jgi:hypothetical protein
MCLQGPNLSSTQVSALIHDLALMQPVMNAVGSLDSLCWKLRLSCQIKSIEACITTRCCEKRVWIDCGTLSDLQASLLWFENCIPSWHAHCIASARAEMESVQGFLAAIQWVMMWPIRYQVPSSPDACFGLDYHLSIAVDALHSEHVLLVMISYLISYTISYHMYVWYHMQRVQYHCQNH